MASDEGNRKHQRKHVKVDIRIAHSLDQTSGELIFESLDLSEGGAFLQSDLLLDLHDLVVVTIPIPSEMPVSARGRVVWVTRDANLKGGAGMGIEFSEISVVDRRRLAAFLGRS